MKKLKFLIFVFLAFLFFSCGGGFEMVENRVIVSKSFVLGYARFDEVRLKPIILEKENDTMPITIRLYIDPIEVWFRMVAHEECNLEKNDLEKYRKLCEKHGDTAFNREISIYQTSGVLAEPKNMVLEYDLEKISVVSDADFDEKHPAGAELGDIVEYVGFSPYQFIKDGYVMSNFRRKQNFITFPDKFGFQSIEKRVSELTSEDLKMVGFNELENCVFGYLYFPVLPTKSKKHNLTIRLTTDEGETFEAKCLVEF